MPTSATRQAECHASTLMSPNGGYFIFKLTANESILLKFRQIAMENGYGGRYGGKTKNGGTEVGYEIITAGAVNRLEEIEKFCQLHDIRLDKYQMSRMSEDLD